MTTAIQPRHSVTADLQEKVLLQGDLSRLTPAERLSYYQAVCNSLGLNPLTQPFEYIQLNGKLKLYARKDCTDQLRNDREISVHILSREAVDGVFIVTSRATDKAGRTDESIGAVAIANLQGEAKANAMMKAETKSKRRVTLSFCGLGILDESEVEDVDSTEEAKPTEPKDNGKPSKAQSVLSKMKQAKPAAQEQTNAPMDQWQSEVADCEDYLRGTEQGKNMLRSIRAGFHIEGNGYPMLEDEKHQYLDTLKAQVKRMSGT